jgi:hypothetical protein
MRKLGLKVALLVVTAMLMVSCGEQPEVPKIPGVSGPHFHIQDGIDFNFHGI